MTPKPQKSRYTEEELKATYESGWSAGDYYRENYGTLTDEYEFPESWRRYLESIRSHKKGGSE